MNPRLLEITARKKEIQGLVERAATLEELQTLRAELDGLMQEEAMIIERERIAGQLQNNPGQGNPVTPNAPPASEMYETVEYRSAFMNYVMSGGETAIPVEYREAGPTATSDVGAVIPTNIVNRIIDKLQTSGNILREVTQTNLKGGVSYPTSSVKPVATWVAEDATSDKQKKTVTGITFAYHKLRCAVSMTLAVEATTLAVFEQTIIKNIAEAMVIALEKAIIDGTGNNQPKGIAKETVPAERTIKLPANTLDYESVVAAEAALPLAYESNSKWIMSKKTFMSFAGAVDKDGQPIARVNYGTAGAPERFILGRPVILCDHLESLTDKTTADKLVAILFNLKDYAINTNYRMGMKKYEDNDTDQQVMKSIMLADGKVIDGNGLVFVKAHGPA